MEPKLPAYVILQWSDEIDYWRLVAVADSEDEAIVKRDHYASKGSEGLHVLAVASEDAQ